MNDIPPSAFTYKNIKMGKNVEIGHNVIIYDNVEIGDNCWIGAQCILGEPLASFYKDSDHYENPPLKIGSNSIIRSGTILYAGSVFGGGFETGHRTTIREHCEFGDYCRVGTNADIQGFVKAGNYCRFHSQVFVAPHSIIKDYAWMFPRSMLLDDKYPPSEMSQGPTLEDYAIIGAGAIIMPRVIVGKDAVVAAGALVVRNVPKNTLVVGAPARAKGLASDLPGHPWRDHFSRGYPWA